MIEPGFYWVRPWKGADWEPAELDADHADTWWLTGGDTPLQSVFEIGPRLTPPEELP